MQSNTTMTLLNDKHLQFGNAAQNANAIIYNDTNDDLTSDDNSFEYNIANDDSFSARVLNFVGNGNRFIFQPNNESSNPSDFAICVLDQGSAEIEQVAPNVYSISLSIREVW